VNILWISGGVLLEGRKMIRSFTQRPVRFSPTPLCRIRLRQGDKNRLESRRFDLEVILNLDHSGVMKGL